MTAHWSSWLGILVVSSLLGALIATGCGGADTYCQTGAKYGTSCTTLQDVRNPPGAPVNRNESAWWNQSPPPGRFGSAGPPAGTGTSVPMSSPAWRPAAATSSSAVPLTPPIPTTPSLPAPASSAN